MRTIGIIIIFLGVIFLLKNLGIIDINISFWGTFWPLLFIFIGLKMIFGARERNYSFWSWKYKRPEQHDNNQ